MPKPRGISSRQLDLLLQLMEQNRDLANGRLAGGPLAHQQVTRFWANVAMRLNSCADGATKEPNAWKKYWHEIKYRAKKRAAEVRVSVQGTGGGPGVRPLTVMEERVLNIMGSVAYQGLPEVQIPVQLPSNAPSSSQDHHAPSSSQDHHAPPSPPQAPIVIEIAALPQPQPPSLPQPQLPDLPQPQPPEVPQPQPPQPQPRQAPPQIDIEVNRDRRRRERAAERNIQVLDAEPPAWARNYEERRLALEESNAETLRRIATALESIMEFLRNQQ